MKRFDAITFTWVLSVAVFLSKNTVSAHETLYLKKDDSAATISVFRGDSPKPILTQNARPDFRPYLHPIVAPDGKGELTEYSPGHHKHQTGLYWGFTRVNGRDFFHHPEGEYWRRVSATVLKGEADEHDSVQWQTVYELLDADGETLLTETQTWSMTLDHGEYILDLVWKGEAQQNVTIGKYDYGGMFLRMPWKPGIEGEVFNAARQRNARAEGQRSMWVDVGMKVAGRDDLAHIAIFDHTKNKGFPQPWRVDGQLGVGPVRARMGDWHIKQGESETIRHQLRVYTGKLNDVDLTEKWKKYAGQGGTYALWGIAQKEGRQAKFLSPQEAVDASTTQEGFKVNAFASEPMITQPMAFCWDDRGRMWIAENRDYESRGAGFANGGDSRILILEDTDRDGVADSRKVFAEGIPFPAGIAVGFDGLWLGAPPNLLYVPDKDHDDKADTEDIEVRLTGWGIRDRHETLNSFHWGPDGWLYGCQGFATPSMVGKPKGDGKLYKHRDPFPKNFEYADAPTEIDGGIWRYHPTKDRFEVVAHGFSNPWGIDYDAKGQLFISACVIPHLWHVVPGGIYHRQGGRHINPHVYSDIRTIADHRHRSAHGGARIYLSDAFPEKYHDRIFMANIHEHAVLTDILEPSGSGFIGRHGDDFMLANNAQWIGFSMEIGPEGGVYVLDWHDADICGKDVLNKDTGRVFRIMPETVNANTDWPRRYDDVSKLDDAHLVEFQLSKSAWHARRARLNLQMRAEAGTLKPTTAGHLRQTFAATSQNDPDYRLRALWALHAVKALSESDLAAALQDNDEHIRAWAIQLLGEDFNVSQNAITKFEAMAQSDSSAVVRLYLASVLQRIEHDSRWGIAEALVQRSEDSNDHNIPKMVWFGIEPIVAESPAKAIELASASQLPMVTRHIGRRLVDGDKLDQLVARVGGSSVPSGSRQQLLLGMRDALEGQTDIRTPAAWPVVYAKYKGDSQIGRLVTELAQQLGDSSAAAELLTTLQDSNASTEDKQKAIRSLALQSDPALAERIPTLLGEESLRVEAIRAIAAFDDVELATDLLEQYNAFSPAEKLEVIHTLAARSKFGWELTQAIKSNAVPRRDVPAYVARQLQRVVGNGFLEVWGPIESLSSETKAEIAKYNALLTDDALAKADKSHGRDIFKRTCSACHKLYGEGGNVGPDITGANRTNLEYLLGNILTPSAIIQDAYKMEIVLTDEGRVYSGIPAAENERQLHLRVAGQTEPVVIAKSQIESRDVAPISMMPEGLLRNLKDSEVLDLIAYLKHLKQVPNKE